MTPAPNQIRADAHKRVTQGEAGEALKPMTNDAKMTVEEVCRLIPHLMRVSQAKLIINLIRDLAAENERLAWAKVVERAVKDNAGVMLLPMRRVSKFCIPIMLDDASELSEAVAACKALDAYREGE